MARPDRIVTPGSGRPEYATTQVSPVDSATARQTASRWAISRGQLFMLLAILLPAITSMLAPIFSNDVAYQIRTGQLMLEAGANLTADPFTFTMAGQPWLNQQWGASLALGLGFDVFGWSGLLVMRALFIGATFGLVFLACRGVGATKIVSSLVTLGAFVVAATNLALRSQTFGLLCFAVIVAILVYRRKHPWLLWLIPLVMIVWANTHGSFFIGWAAIWMAALEDIVGRSRLALTTVAISILAVLATALNPWGFAMWRYVVDLSTSTVLPQLITEWQATSVQSPTGAFFYLSVALTVVLLIERRGAISWLQLGWLAFLALVAIRAVRGVIWWAIGAAPTVAILVDGLTIRGRPLADPGIERHRAIGYTAIAGTLIVLTVAALPFWRPGDALFGPEGILREAPRGVTEALLAEATPDDRLLADQTWASWFELAVPGVPVMVDSRIELFDNGILGDYLHVTSGRADWQAILDRWQVSLMALPADEQSQLIPFLEGNAAWALLYGDDEGRVYRRARVET